MKTNGWLRIGAGFLAYGGAICLSAALMACGGPATGVIAVRPAEKPAADATWRTPAAIVETAERTPGAEGGTGPISTPVLPEIESVDGMLEFGRRARAEGKHDLALAAFDRVIQIDPAKGPAHVNRAISLLALGRPREAIVSARKGIERDYRSGAAHHVLGRCYHALGLVEQAETTYLDAISQDSGFAWPYNNLGLLRIEQGRETEAEPLLRRAVALDGENAVAWNNLGVSLERQGRIGEAREAYRAAIEADPTHAKAIASYERLKGVRDAALPSVVEEEEETADRS